MLPTGGTVGRVSSLEPPQHVCSTFGLRDVQPIPLGADWDGGYRCGDVVLSRVGGGGPRGGGGGGGGGRPPPAPAWIPPHYEDITGGLIEAMQTDQRNGHVRDDAPVERIVRSMVALMDGLQLQWLLDSEFDMGATLAEHVQELKLTWSIEG